MTTQHTDDPLDTLLQELGPADPPEGFADSVLAKVARTSIEDTRVHGSGKIIPFSSGGIVMSRKAMWALAAAATIILAVFVARGFPPVGRGTEGAIGAAKKYQAPQMAANDVVTGDASAQEFLQSDTFDRLVKDPEAVAMLSDARMRAALRDAGFVDAIQSTAVRDALRNGMISRIFNDAVGRAALEDALKSDLAEKAIRTVEARADLHPAMKADLTNALRDANVRQALARDAFRDQLRDAGMRAMLARPEMSAALHNPNFVAALNARGFSAAVRSQQFESAIAAH